MAAKSETAAPDAFRVVLTKITVPACDDGVLRRLRAESVVVRGKRVTTVFGTAGFGKTLAVAKWASRQHAAVAWYTIDAYDNRPSVFWRHLKAAIGHAHQQPDDENVIDRPPDGGSFADPLLHAIGPETEMSDDLHRTAHCCSGRLARCALPRRPDPGTPRQTCGCSAFAHGAAGSVLRVRGG